MVAADGGENYFIGWEACICFSRWQPYQHLLPSSHWDGISEGVGSADIPVYVTQSSSSDNSSIGDLSLPLNRLGANISISLGGCHFSSSVGNPRRSRISSLWECIAHIVAVQPCLSTWLGSSPTRSGPSSKLTAMP